MTARSFLSDSIEHQVKTEKYHHSRLGCWRAWRLSLIFYTIVSEVIDYQHVAVFKMV
jgi:hypothetical protein